MKIEDIKKYSLIGEGTMSRCYKLENGNVFKEFKNPISLFEINKFKYFLKYSNPSFYFPIDYVDDKKSFKGYIMKYAKGVLLADNFRNVDLLKLSTHSFSLEKDINYLSSGKIIISDLHGENILYDNNKLNVIDSDDYRINCDLSTTEVRKTNMKIYRSLMVNLFLENINSNDLNKKLVQKIIKYLNLDVPSSALIVEIKEMIDKYYKDDIKSLNDITKTRK